MEGKRRKKEREEIKGRRKGEKEREIAKGKREEREKKKKAHLQDVKKRQSRHETEGDWDEHLVRVVDNCLRRPVGFESFVETVERW